MMVTKQDLKMEERIYSLITPEEREGKLSGKVGLTM